MKRNIIFDLDGTLVDSLPGIAAAVNRALPHSLDSPSDLRSRIGPSIRSILRGLADLPGRAVPEPALDQLEGAFRRYYDSEGWRETIPFSGAGELLHRLHSSGKRIFLVTNKPWTPVFGILRMLGWRAYFEHVLTPDSSDPAFRDKTEMLRFLTDRRSLNIDSCVMIGDTIDDYRAAAGVGMDAIFVAHGYGSAELMSECPHCEIVPNLSAVAERFAKTAAKEAQTEELVTV